MLTILRRISAGIRLRMRLQRLARLNPAAFSETLGGAVAPALPEQARVAVLKLDHFGDFILALPALERLRKDLPDAHITLICGSWNRAVAEACGLVNRVVVSDVLGERRQATWGQAMTAAALVEFTALSTDLGDLDLAIDLRFLPDTRPLLSLLRARFRAGFPEPWSPTTGLDLAMPTLLDYEADPRRGLPIHSQTRGLALVTAVLNTLRPPDRPARRLLAGGGTPTTDEPYLIIAPGAGKQIKIWPVERLARVADRVATAFGLRIVVLGGADDKDLAATLTAALPEGLVLDLTGLTALDETPDIIGAAALFIGMDSGLTHLSAGLGVATVCIFSGSVRLEAWRPLGRRVRTVRGGATCSPCYLSSSDQCPHAMACLRAVSEDDVAAACHDLLAGPAVGSAGL